MKQEDQFRQPGPQQTRWSLVRRAADRGTPEGSAALDELLDLYLPAIDAYLSARSDVPPADAQDLRQGFVAERILEGSLLQSAQPDKGKFRSLLRKSLSN